MSFRRIWNEIHKLRDATRGAIVQRRPGVLTTVKPSGVIQTPVNQQPQNQTSRKRVVALWG